jgi:asparagine synthase (glutamine-hydrolysing)
MCGICGFIDTSHTSNSTALETHVRRMTDSIRHRGPDSDGAWVDEQHGLALGFRRLAIVDLSPTGNQPMHSADGRYVIVYNGEIYNFAELRRELLALGASFRGTSDTEIMLAAFSAWGLAAGLRRLNGMFAMALWDRQEQALHLVRDRLGLKPLYYGWQNGLLLFGSELKALRAHPSFHADVDRDALTLYLRYNYIPAPHSIYTGIFKLPPACILTIRPGPGGRDAVPSPYWSARQAAQDGLDHPFDGDERQAVDMLDAHLRRSLAQRMIADVPLGAFLSGGVDSSAIVALMQAQSSRPVKTFTIGFHEAGFDEALHARAVAQHLGTDHTELYVTPQEARAVIPLLPSLYDEPFSDSSQIPTYLVSKMARGHVTVSLSGDGGDELFGGYNRYRWVPRIWQRLGWLPAPLRSAAANLIQAVDPQAWATGIRAAGRLSRAARDLPNAGDKAHRLAETLRAPTPEALYFGLASHWQDPASVVLGGHAPAPLLSDLPATLAERMMFQDLVTYLPDDILAKVDRASMGVSLEARAPYVDDHETVELAWRLPLHLKVRNGQGKWILRQVLYRYVPQTLIERPKMGFGVPIDTWLRGELRDWAETLLDEGRLRREGYFDPAPIRHMWQEHLSGSRNRQHHLWDILMFQAWLQATQAA